MPASAGRRSTMSRQALEQALGKFAGTRGSARSARRSFIEFRRNADEHDYGEGWHDDLLQGLGAQERAADRLPSWLATERRRLGHPDALLRGEGVSRYCS